MLRPHMSKLVLPLDPPRAAGLHIYLQVARAIAEDIRRGRLLPGAKVPSSRLVAQQLYGNHELVSS
jgi:GntR family transcriptional regulator/MocR family aminotransferase